MRALRLNSGTAQNKKTVQRRSLKFRLGTVLPSSCVQIRSRLGLLGDGVATADFVEILRPSVSGSADDPEMPVLPDAAVLAGGEHDQAHERAGDRSPKCGPQRPAPSLASRTGTCGLGTSSSRLTLSVWSDYRKLEIESSGGDLCRWLDGGEGVKSLLFEGRI